MRRTFVAALLCLLCLLCLPAVAAGRPAGAPGPTAKLAACGSGAGADQRFAVFVGSMPALRGTRRMAMRFELQVRRGASRRWSPVMATRKWYRSDLAGRARFVQTQRVERLPQGATYRARVRFRWYGVSGVQLERVRSTPVCRQPDQRPDLEIESFAVAPGPDASSSRYLLGVRNAGRSAADAFTVGVAGLERDAVRSVPGLPAGERTTVELVAPRCRPGEIADFRLDVEDTVAESDEADNGFRWPCGAPIDSQG
jgi:CARDB